MVIILREFGDEALSLPQVQVLLATFNGEKYLAEFLESLSSQVGVDIFLVISDDGSTDNTHNIIEAYKPRFPNLEFILGPKQGPAVNFFNMLNLANREYLAFADQDDIWLPTHLFDSIQRISKNPAWPALTFSRVIEFGDNFDEAIWPLSMPELQLESFIFENYARGCTIVINRAAYEVLRALPPKYFIMHDWWFVLVILTVGQVSFGSKPEILYRIHSENYVGGRKSTFKRLLNFLLTAIHGEWKPIRQMMELRRFEAIAHPQVRSIILRPPSLLALKAKKLRSTLFEDMAIRTILLLISFRYWRSILHFIRRQLLKIFAKLSYVVWSFKGNVIERLQIFKSKNLLAFRNHKLDDNLFVTGKIAIFVCFPRMALRNSALRLIQTLKFNGYSVLMIVNKNENQSAWIEEFINLDISIISRINLGRDFGAYKTGMNFLFDSKDVASINEVIIINDSVIYTEKSRSFIQLTLQGAEHWKCLFKSEEINTHAQSFFQSFTADILNDERFRQYWKEYLPISDRKHMIKKGELGLSQTLIRMGYHVKPTIDFLQHLTEGDSYILNQFESKSLWSNIFVPFEATVLDLDVIRNLRMKQICENLNQTHYLGLLASRLYGAPLKLDLLKFEICPRQGIGQELKESIDSNVEFAGLMQLLTTSPKLNVVQNLWKNSGYI